MENPIMVYLEIQLFVFTFGIVIFNLLFYFSLFAEKTIDWPGILMNPYTKPTMWFLLYPSVFYQIWFWFYFYGFFN